MMGSMSIQNQLRTGRLRTRLAPQLDRLQVIDAHTGGEPTRVVLGGGPDLGSGPLAQRRDRLQKEFAEFRSAVIGEPRGSSFLVGALLCKPNSPGCVVGVVFFNNAGVLGMCGHAAMGVAVAMAHDGQLSSGRHKLETPVGIVSLQLHADHERVSLENVASYRHAEGITVGVAGYGTVSGDVAWGGNWFFLVREHDFELEPDNVPELLEFTLAVRQSLRRGRITGARGAAIDHIELFSPSGNPQVDSRSFVLCPDGGWDRSPCGTGTSAKIACLAAEGRLAPGEVWRQESPIGSVFEATYRLGADGMVIPSLTGSAWVMAESTLLLNHRDPFRTGIR